MSETVQAKRQVVAHWQEQFGLSQRRACQLVDLQRCSFRYQSRRPDDAALRQRLCEVAQERPRFGYVRLHVLLRREGWGINHKKVYRLYREQGLKLRPKKRKRIASNLRISQPLQRGLIKCGQWTL